MPKPKEVFAGPIGILTSAVAAVTLVFGLFSSILANLVPPIDNSQQTVGFVSFGTVIVLLILTLLIRKRLTGIQTRTVATASAALFLIALTIYFPFRDFTRAYVYRFPPASAPHKNQTFHIRGELHEKGLDRVKDMTVAQAVYQLGGPDQVNSMGILWHEKSRLHIISKMERYYVALIMFLTTALFSAGLAVWRQQQPK